MNKDQPKLATSEILYQFGNLQAQYYALQKNNQVELKTCKSYQQLEQRAKQCADQLNQLQIINKELLKRKQENEQKLLNVSVLLKNVQERQKMIERAILGKKDNTISNIDFSKYNTLLQQYQNAQQVVSFSGQNLDQLIDELTNLVAKLYQKIERV